MRSNTACASSLCSGLRALCTPTSTRSPIFNEASICSARAPPGSSAFFATVKSALSCTDEILRLHELRADLRDRFHHPGVDLGRGLPHLIERGLVLRLPSISNAERCRL